MKELGYGIGALIIILLIVAVFTFTYNTSVENEYFANYLELEKQLRD